MQSNTHINNARLPSEAQVSGIMKEAARLTIQILENIIRIWRKTDETFYMTQRNHTIYGRTPVRQKNEKNVGKRNSVRGVACRYSGWSKIN
jgi:hypothetical protein